MSLFKNKFTNKKHDLSEHELRLGACCKYGHRECSERERMKPRRSHSGWKCKKNEVWGIWGLTGPFFCLEEKCSRHKMIPDKVINTYDNKTLNTSARNYWAPGKELLGIVKAIDRFHHYLYGWNFTVRTDHSALWGLLKLTDLEGQIGWMLAKL